MKRKKPGARLVAVIDAELDTAMREVVHASRGTISGFVQDAIAVRLANYEPPADYVRRKRGDKGVRQAEVFDPAYFDRFGFPLQLQPTDARFELRQAAKAGDAGILKLMRQWWINAGLSPADYGNTQLEETLRQMEAV